MRETNYVNVEGWMKERLGLRGKELFAYAIVYGFSQDRMGWYVGGRSYIADWLGCTTKTAGNVLGSLVDKGLVVRKEAVSESGWAYQYQAVGDGEETSQGVGKKTPGGEGKNFPGGREKTSHITTKGDYKEENNRESRRFAPPTRDEVAEYAMRMGYTSFNADRFIDYYESNGWMVGRNKMKSWEAAVRSWAARDKAPARPALHANTLNIPDDVRSVIDRVNGGA